MKRLLHSSLLAVIVILLVAIPILAATYYADIQILETNGTSYTQLPLIYSVDNQYLADNGYMTATALDTRVITGAGTELPHLVVDDRLLFASSIGANSTTNLDYTLGDVALPDMPIIVGYSGYNTTADDVDLELADDFNIELSGYIDTSSGGTIVYKDSAFNLIAAGDTITSSILPEVYTDPTGNNDPDVDWANEAQAYDGNLALGADAIAIPATSWSGFLELTHAGVNCYALRYYAEYDVAEFVQIDVDIYYDAAWHDVYEGIYANLTWETRYFGSHAVTAARVRFYNTNAGVITENDLLREFDFVDGTTDAIAINVSPGAHKVETWADTVNLYLSIDDAVAGDGYDSLALVAAVPDNVNNWILFGSNSVPYLDYYQHTVANSSLETWYQPVTMIIGTALPDRAIGLDPTGAAGVGWAGLANTRDNNIGTFANNAPGAGNWTDWLTVSRAATTISAVRWYAGTVAGWDLIEIDVHLDGVWEDLFDGAPSATWVTGTFTEGSVDSIRYRGHQTGALQVLLGEVDFGYSDSAENGVITWGTNPTGTSITMGSLISTSQPVPTGVVTDPSQDIVGESGQSGWTDVIDTAALQSNPLYAIVYTVAEVTDFTQGQAWLMIATFAVIASMLLVFSFVPHQLITVVVGAFATWLFISMGIYPYWTIFVFVLIGIAVVLWERVPSV